MCLVFGSCWLCLLHYVFVLFGWTYVTTRYYCRWLSGNVSASNSHDIVFFAQSYVNIRLSRDAACDRLATCSMSKIHTVHVHLAYIHHEHLPNVGKYSIDGSYGNNQSILHEGPSENRSIAELFLPKITPSTWQHIWPNHSNRTDRIICDMCLMICLYIFKSYSFCMTKYIIVAKEIWWYA